MKKKFSRTPNNTPNSRYSWSPIEYSAENKIGNLNGIPKCFAIVGSQGVDNVVTYVYNDDHLAYVECNYVE